MLCVWWRGVGCCNHETNISAEKAGPLKRLNDHANGFLAEEEGREALPQRETESISNCHYRASSEPIWLVYMSLSASKYMFVCAESGESSTQMDHRGDRRSFNFHRAQLEAELTDLIQSRPGFLSFSIETAVCHVLPDRIMDTGYWTLARP